MRYSLLAGGKRIRPVLALATARALGRDPAERPAARGRARAHPHLLADPRRPAGDGRRRRCAAAARPATCAFGEDVAILAGDGLYAEAFRLLLTRQEGEPAHLLAAVAELAAATGVDGMVGGQYHRRRAARRRRAPRGCGCLHELKTGRLIGASRRLRTACSRASPRPRSSRYRVFAAELGVLFQIVDDILDVTGTDAASASRRAATSATASARTSPSSASTARASWR